MTTHIHHGAWINWSHGTILGATVTLGDRSGGLLTSFIATFVTVVGSQLWRILSYIFHQIRSSKAPQDGLHHQQQVVFRNMSSPGGAAWTFLQQTWYWRGKADWAVLRTLPWALVSICYLALFAVLAIFSSEISKAPGSARLIVGQDCGYWRINSSSPDSTKAWAQKVTNDSLVAATYARACYGGLSDSLQCGRYPVSSIKWTSDQNSTCPFESGTCVYGDTAAYKITSEMIDSHDHLGINAPKHDRVQYQKITSCAPLRASRFVAEVNGSTENGPGMDGDVLYEYLYGPVGDVTEYTYLYNTHAILDQFGYTLQAYAATAGFVGESWVPVPAINRSDADISLLFLAPNAIRFEEPCDDPVFGAHILVSNNATSYYTSDLWVSVLACAEQHRVCNPTNGVCTKPVGVDQLLPVAVAADSGLNFNLVQQGTIDRIAYAADFTSVYYATYTRMQSALRAQETVTQLDQAPLPANQWMIEVGSWFDDGLARLQQSVQEYATGPTNIAAGSYLWQPGKDGNLIQEALCYSQRINDTQDTMSFSVLGIAIVFIIGGIILATSLIIDSAVGWLQKKFHTGLHARRSWMVDDKLQLQKMIFQELHMGNWSTTKEEKVPTTKFRERFLGLSELSPEEGGPIGFNQGRPHDNNSGSETAMFVPPDGADLGGHAAKSANVYMMQEYAR